jgi:4-amino-4-deoxy-L-arabinose transferase-like glycosyltransferase
MQWMSNPNTLRRVGLAAALAVLAVIWFGNIESRKLIKPDEGRYAEVPREMVASGDWLTPRLNGIKYFEKPPLQYWATATAYSAFGLHHWTARLWSALTGLLGIFVIWFTGRRLYGEPAGILSALVAASSVHYVALAHMNTLDMGLTFFMGFSLCTFLLAQRQDVPLKERKLWMALSWAATAAGILSKGPVALILPGLTILVYSLVQRDCRVWLRLDPLPGVLLMAAITAPWFVWVSAVNPEFRVSSSFMSISRVFHPCTPARGTVVVLCPDPAGRLVAVDSDSPLRRCAKAGEPARSQPASTPAASW